MKYWILGRVLPAVPADFGQSPDYHPLDDFTREEARKLNLVGLKFRLGDHTEHLVHGDIVAQTDGPDGSKYITGLINTNERLGKMMLDRIQGEIAKMTDLSLRHVAKYWREGYELKVDKTPVEVSILTEARRKKGENCNIFYVASNKAVKKIGNYTTIRQLVAT